MLSSVHDVLSAGWAQMQLPVIFFKFSTPYLYYCSCN